jgi:hypothetical protein
MDDLKSDNVEAMNPQGAAAVDAAHKLAQAFCWEDAAEGYKYWQGVYDRLIYIASLDSRFTFGDYDE